MRVTLMIVALTIGFAAPSLAQTKEGTFSGTYSSYGTYRATPVRTERVFATFDENGLSLADGLIDHMTWHCWGLVDIVNGTSQAHGRCVGTDPAGDQLALDFGPDEKHTPDQKSWSGSGTLTTGTGKFAGVSGGYSYVTHGRDFRPGAAGAYIGYKTFEGHYKLPPPEATGSAAPSSTTLSK
jgi:hypothetical protein